MSSATTRVAPRRAMVLAAGLGTRMRPLTDSTPKPLVKVAGKPLIDHVLDRLADAGVGQAVVNVHHFADQLQRHLAHRQRPKIVISDERGLLLGTGGGVKRALPELGDAPFFHVNSDTIWIDGVKSNFSRLADSFDAAATDAEPGTIVDVSRDALHVATGDHCRIAIEQIQPEGKRPMSVRDYLAGRPIRPGARFTDP